MTIVAVLSCAVNVLAVEADGGTLSGRVVDSAGKPVTFANVIAINLADTTALPTAAISDESGNFALRNLAPGEYKARVTYLGYRQTEVPFSVKSSNSRVNVGDVVLSENATAVDAVEVTGMRSQMQFDIDKKVFNVDQNIASTGGSASDILGNIPSVEVDGDGDVSLRGNSSVTVWINGKESGITADNRAQILEQMPAESIEKIEVITNPSAKFSPEGTSGIINIVLKKNRMKGYYGGVQASLDSRLGYNASANFNYSSPVADFYINAGFRHHKRVSGATTYRRNIGADTTFLRSKSDNEGTGNHLFGRAGVTFHATPKDDIGLAGFGMFGAMRSTADIRYTSDVPGSFLSSLRTTSGKNRMTGGHAEVNYRHTFRDDHTLDAIVAYDLWAMNNNTDYDQRSYYAIDTTRSYQRQKDNIHNGGWTVQIDYANQINEGNKVEAGYKATLNSENSPSEYFAGTSADDLAVLQALYNRFKYAQDVHALYLNYAGKYRRFGYQVGLRGEYTLTRTRSLGYGQSDGDVALYTKDYFKIFPSVFLSYSLPHDNELQINYTRRIERPRGGQLNSFRNMSDSTNISFGNPRLEPQYANAFEFNYIKTWDKHILSLSAYYRQTGNVIQRISYMQDDVLMTTFSNVSRDQSAGIEIVGKNRLFKILDLTTTVNMYYSKISGFDYKVDDLTTVTGSGSENFSWDARMVANLGLPKGFSLQITGGYTSRRVIAQGFMMGNYFVDAGLRKSFKDFSVSLNVRDIFDSRGRHSVTSGKGFIQDSDRWWGGRRFRLTASYSFGNMKPKKSKQTQSDSTGGGYDTGEGDM